MSTLLPPPTAPVPRPGRWTLEEFYRMAEQGLFRNQRAELIGGKIVVMSPQNWPHASAVDHDHEVLKSRFGPGFWVRMQLPLTFRASAPEPDISVVRGRRDDYSDHPTTALLLVEISDTTLAFDQGEKASLYAAAQIEDYWIVDLNNRRLEVRRRPIPDAAQPHGFAYADLTTLLPGDSVSPLAAPQISIRVDELLP
jgi:Uma2 family endonuclease